MNAIERIAISGNHIRVVLTARRWVRCHGPQWVEIADWFDAPLAYRDEFRVLAQAATMPVRSYMRHTEVTIYKWAS